MRLFTDAYSTLYIATPKMKIIDLKVPYTQKDAAKALGARWSVERKCWFVPSGALLAPFAEWLPAGEWLAEHDKSLSKKGGLSMTRGAIRTRAKKEAAKLASASHELSKVGAGSRPSVGDAGPPWAV